MAGAYRPTIQKLMAATGPISITGDTIKARLVRTSAYTYSNAHEFASSLPATIVADVTLGSKSVTNGEFDAADAVFTAVPSGAAINGVVIYKDTGSAATSPVLVFLDGFSVTPNGGDITLQWANSTPFIWSIAA